MTKPADRIASHVFREYDIRGVVGKEIHESLPIGWAAPSPAGCAPKGSVRW